MALACQRLPRRHVPSPGDSPSSQFTGGGSVAEAASLSEPVGSVAEAPAVRQAGPQALQGLEMTHPLLARAGNLQAEASRHAEQFGQHRPSSRPKRFLVNLPCAEEMHWQVLEDMTALRVSKGNSPLGRPASAPALHKTAFMPYAETGYNDAVEAAKQGALAARTRLQETLRMAIATGAPLHSGPELLSAVDQSPALRSALGSRGSGGQEDALYSWLGARADVAYHSSGGHRVPLALPDQASSHRRQLRKDGLGLIRETLSAAQVGEPPSGMQQHRSEESSRRGRGDLAEQKSVLMGALSPAPRSSSGDASDFRAALDPATPHPSAAEATLFDPRGDWPPKMDSSGEAFAAAGGEESPPHSFRAATAPVPNVTGKATGTVGRTRRPRGSPKDRYYSERDAGDCRLGIDLRFVPQNFEKLCRTCPGFGEVRKASTADGRRPSIADARRSRSASTVGGRRSVKVLERSRR